MRLTCLIVDDDVHSAAYVKHIVLKTPELELIGIEQEPLRALRKVQQHQLRPDVILLDIKMPGLDGIEFAARLKGAAHIIFITSDDSRALEAYQNDGVDYILKPFSVTRLAKAVTKVVVSQLGKKSLDDTKQNMLMLQHGKKGQYKKFDPENIVFIEGARNNIMIHTADGLAFTVAQTLQSIERQLINLPFFRRIHKTFIINLAHVISITGNDIDLTGNYRVSIGPKFKAGFLNEVVIKKLL